MLLRGVSGRWPGCGRSESARRAGSPECPGRAIARVRRRKLPAAPLPPNRSRRAGGSVLRTHDPPPGAALLPPLPSPRRDPDRTHLNAAVLCAGDAPGDRQGFVEILRLNEIVAAEL